MTGEVKQALERYFDIYLTAQDIRCLTFAKLRDMADKQEHIAKEAKYTKAIKLLTQLIGDSNISSDICLEMTTRQEMDKERIFLIPGAEGYGSVFNSLASKIKAPATCLQHGVNIIPASQSIVQFVVTLLPVRRNNIITNLRRR